MEKVRMMYFALEKLAQEPLLLEAPKVDDDTGSAIINMCGEVLFSFVQALIKRGKVTMDECGFLTAEFSERDYDELTL